MVMEDKMLRYAAAHPFEEVCGLVIDNEHFYPCANVSETPYNSFKISPDDYIKADELGVITAVFHSHVDDIPVLSARDRQQQVISGLPWLLYSGGRIRKFRPVAHLLGRKFEHGKTDCYALFRDTYHLCGVDLPDFERLDGWWLRGENLYLKNLPLNGFYQVDAQSIQPGDVIIRQPFKGADPCHAMIYLGDNTVLHHDNAGLLSRREQMRPAYVRQTHSIWRSDKCSNLDLRAIFEDITAKCV
ncbi:C40 family peptidase [Escherichia coli]|uniref:C40 family peptidase n=1 Tax=Escherichia coli TaxID=562 RepID=UPI001BFC9DED|nr:NlpC/P60 family protein [Escherichia coli]